MIHVDEDAVKFFYGPVFGLVGALIGLLGGWLTAQYATRAANIAWKHERDKATDVWVRAQADATRAWERAQLGATQAWERTRSDTKANLTVELVRDLGTHLAAATHAMTWLTWLARFDQKSLSDTHVENYDKAMAVIQPQIIGTVAGLVATNPEVSDRLNDIVGRVFELDAQIGLACIAFRDGNPSGLVEANDETLALFKGLIDSVRGVSDHILEANTERRNGKEE